MDGAGKILERLILNRIAEQVASGLVVNQFGFRQGKGTFEAIEEMLRIAAEAAKGVARDFFGRFVIFNKLCSR